MTQGPSSNAVTVSPSCAGFLSGHRWEGLQQPVDSCGFFQTLPSIMLVVVVVYVRHTLVHMQYKIPSKQITNEIHFFFLDPYCKNKENVLLDMTSWHDFYFCCSPCTWALSPRVSVLTPQQPHTIPRCPPAMLAASLRDPIPSWSPEKCTT